MSLANKKIFVSVLLVMLYMFIFPKRSLACTYNATISGNHVDFEITSDTDKLAVIQYIRQSGSALVTKMYGANVGMPWSYTDDPNCDISPSTPIGCRQIHPSYVGEGAFWQWYDWSMGKYHSLPSYIWGLDFNSPPTYESIGVEYGTIPGTTGDAWRFCTRTGDVPIPTPVPTPTPMPSPVATAIPTPTPSPTPSPTPTPVPVTKVVLIPGMGASWNLDAFMNCKQYGYVGDWTISPYAKRDFEFAKTSLENAGWNTIPFFYDWRQDVRDNSVKLDTLINSVASSEKVNLVGHSMGGLIGRSYIEQQSGGKASKFLAVGAPNQGSALAYPALVGGQIWINNLDEKIGATLFLKHCGKIGSFQNVVPTYDYLRDWETQNLKQIITSKVKNNYLPTNFAFPFWGVKIGTLAGTNVSTLKIIDVVNNTKWLDGKPINGEYSLAGDGVVLTQSAQIPGAFSNTVINQSHSGIIGSTEGVNKILEFLGSPGIADPSYVEPVSALIVIGSPGTFWITDKDGVVTQSDNGMVAIVNPKDGNYKLQIIPTASTSKFIISKFTADGRTTYNEHTYKGLVQKPKIIRFNSTKEVDESERENEDFDSDRR